MSHPSLPLVDPRRLLSAALVLSLLVTIAASASLLGSPLGSASAPAGSAHAAPDYGDLPLSFQPSAGRYEGIDYLSSGSAGSVAVGPGGMHFTQSYGTKKNPKASAIALALPGAALENPRAQGRQPGVVNDLRGDDPAGHATGIPTFSSLSYPDAWPGIDLHLRGSGANPEYDFELAPGADPGRISLRVAGADRLRIAPSGDLVIHSGGAVFRQQAPVAYQPSAQGRTPVESAFHLDGRTVSFELGAYDPSKRLVIDPVALAYSTYLSGNFDDVANAIAVDSSGAAYVAGYTSSTDFDTVGQIEGNSAGVDAFIAKLNPAGNALAYSTYLGGDGADEARAIAVDSSGAAYVTGYTGSTDFDTVGQIEGDSPGNDAFIAKLNPAGNALTYSTYLGGSGDDVAQAIAVDSSGAAYVSGYTSSADFDAVGPIQGPGGQYDAFISKLNPAGSALAYSTYLGGNDFDSANAIAVDSSGAAYVTGYTYSGDFPTVGQIESDKGVADAFIAKLNPAGSALAYSTYLGGNDFDAANAIAVDTSGAAYVAGYTYSTDFDTVGQIEGDSADYDAFIAKLNPAGSALAYSTYLGGNDYDRANAIALDPTGAAYVAGFTLSTNFDTVGAVEGDSPDYDAFIAKLNPAGGALAYSTYLGGDNSDRADAIAVDSSGAAYVAGWTLSTDFDTVGPIDGNGPAQNAFVAKITAPDTTLLSGPAEGSTTNDATPTFTFSSDNPTAGFECRLDGGPWEDCESPRTLPALGDGSHTFKVRAVDDVGNRDLTPAVRNFTIDTTQDTTPPDVYFTSGPAGLTNDNTPTFGFGMNETGGGFECRTDGGQFSGCTSPATAAALSDGPHSFSVRGSDAAGNRSVVERQILVDTTPPETLIDSAPRKLRAKKKAKARITFHASEPGTATCKVDRAPAKPCSSPFVTRLKPGTHTISIVATDKAGNADPSPARAKIKVKKKRKR